MVEYLTVIALFAMFVLQLRILFPPPKKRQPTKAVYSTRSVSHRKYQTHSPQ